MKDLSKRPLVTVGLLSYERPSMLKRSLDSIANQSYGNLEVIVSDNGSRNPDVAGVLENFARVRPDAWIYRHNVNRGPLWNFRFVLQQARGDMFLWLADDDFWTPDFVDVLVEYALDNRKPSLVYPRCVFFNHSTGEVGARVKERVTAARGIRNAWRQIVFDTDANIYGLMDAAMAKRQMALIKPWPVPDFLVRRSPTLIFDFWSYAFLYGILLDCDYINASESPAVHYVAAVTPPPAICEARKRGLGVLLVTITMLYVHALLALRFVRASANTSNLGGILAAPWAASYLLIRRLGKAAMARRLPATT